MDMENFKSTCSTRRHKHVQDIAALQAYKEQLLLHGIPVPNITLQGALHRVTPHFPYSCI